MQSIREDIAKEHPSIQRSDVVVFFQVAEFVTAFQFYKCSASKVRVIVREFHISAYVSLDLFQAAILNIAPFIRGIKRRFLRIHGLEQENFLINLNVGSFIDSPCVFSCFPVTYKLECSISSCNFSFSNDVEANFFL